LSGAGATVARCAPESRHALVADVEFATPLFEFGFNQMRVRPNILVPLVRNCCSQRRAHANSSPRIASPAGITTNAGPGVTIMMMPMRTTVPPTRAITHRLAQV